MSKSEFYFKSEFHFDNFLLKNGTLKPEYKDPVKSLFFDAMENRLFYRELFNVFTYNYRTKGSGSEDNIENIIKILKLPSEIEILKAGKELGFIREYDFNSYFEYCFEEEVTEDFKKTIDYLSYKKGLYFLYNKNKELIYIGKSRNLSDRIPSSIRERKAYYFKYSLCKTLSDMHILELFYISKLKPEMNNDSKDDDECTFEIDHVFLEESNLIKIVQF